MQTRVRTPYFWRESLALYNNEIKYLGDQQ